MNKRGLSQVVSVLILIVLILVAVGLIWLAVNRFIIQGTGGINTEKFTLDLKIKSATVDIENELATVKVVRNSGEGNLTGIKFIVRDSFSSEIYDFPVTNFVELVERTFELNLSLREMLDPEDIQEISIAPLYITGSSPLEKLGQVTDSVSGNWSIREEEVTGDDGEIPGGDGSCVDDSGCEDDELEGELFCNENNQVIQLMTDYSCNPLGICISSPGTNINETCSSEEVCSGGQCISPEGCDLDSDCDGFDGFLGIKFCDPSTGGNEGPGPILQIFENWSCVDELCASVQETQIREVCDPGQICADLTGDAECFISYDCTSHENCGPGEYCVSGYCEIESSKNEGFVGSSWPPGQNVFFVSTYLPTEIGDVGSGDYIIFKNSDENRCLRVLFFNLPAAEGEASYIQLSDVPTNVSAGNGYEIWLTEKNGCPEEE